jgi:hypothetical protein
MLDTNIILSKEEFANEKYPNLKSRKPCLSVLRKFEPFEKDPYNMDLYNFDSTMLADVLLILDISTTQSLYSHLAYYRAYINWARQKFGHQPTHGQDINVEELVEKHVILASVLEREVNALITREMLYQALEKIYNEQDKAIVVLPFEGVYGKKASDLLGLEIKQVNRNWVRTPNETIIFLSPIVMDILNNAISQPEYYPSNGKPNPKYKKPPQPLYDNGYVIKYSKEDGKLKYDNLQGKVRKVKSYTNLPALSFENIHKSGILDYFFLVQSRKGSLFSNNDRKSMQVVWRRY